MASQSDGFFTQRTALGGQTFVLTFRYNSRMDRWLMDVADANLNPLAYGLVIQGSWPTTKRLQGIIDGLPVGDFLAVDLTGAQRDPTQDTLGGDVIMAYYQP